jgi:hypothetical protein
MGLEDGVKSEKSTLLQGGVLLQEEATILSME